MYRKLKKAFAVPEFWLIFLPALLLILSSAVIGRRTGTVSFFSAKTFRGLVEGFVGWPLFYLVAVLMIFMLAQVILLLTEKKFDSADDRKRRRGEIRSGIFIMAAITIVISAITLATGTLFRSADPIATGSWSVLFAKADQAVFGMLPAYWLHRYPVPEILDISLLAVYSSLGLVIVAVSAISLFANAAIFRKFVSGFFIAAAMSYPLWYFMPALAPAEMFGTNLLRNDRAEEMAESFGPIHVTERVWSLYSGTADSLRETGSLPVSTNPSMHVAWGTIAAYWGSRLFPWAGALFIPWAVLNAFSTVYTLEHYAIDVFGGLIIAYLAILLTKFVFRKASGGEGLLMISSRIREDLFKLAEPLRAVAGRVSGAIKRVWTHSFFRFCVAGTVSFLTDLIVFDILYFYFGLDGKYSYQIFRTISLACAFSVSFSLNSRWSFGCRRSGTGVFVAFSIVTVLGLLFNLGVSTAVLKGLTYYGLSVAISANLGVVGGSLAGMAWNYSLYRFLVFRR